MLKTFADLDAWKLAINLTKDIYSLTKSFPKEELFVLTSQMRRAVISISSNIAESYHRFHTKEKNQFLSIAFGSGSELESQIEVSKVLFPGRNYEKAETLLVEIMKILNNFLSK